MLLFIWFFELLLIRIGQPNWCCLLVCLPTGPQRDLEYILIEFSYIGKIFLESMAWMVRECKYFEIVDSCDSP